MFKKQLDYIKSINNEAPEIAIVLGSGLGDFAEEINIKCTIDYKDIPDFPISTAPDHKGRFVFGEINGKNIVAMQGRVHYYEGYSAEQVVMPIRIMRLLGAKKLILTNAAGGINPSLGVGDFMIINDHISSFVPSPLIGKNYDELGTRFPDMSQAYSKDIINTIKKSAKSCDIDIKEGVYIQFTGPQFESPSEIKMAKLIGADAVGMSTVMEAIAGVHCGFEVGGISMVANLACGISDKPLSDAEVKETADKVAPKFKALLKEVIGNI